MKTSPENVQISNNAEESFQECFMKWLESLIELPDGEVVAIDRKQLNSLNKRKTGKRNSLHG